MELPKYEYYTIMLGVVKLLRGNQCVEFELKDIALLSKKELGIKMKNGGRCFFKDQGHWNRFYQDYTNSNN